MAMILIIGRYLSNLKAIQDSVPDAISPHCVCIEEKDLLTHAEKVFAAYSDLKSAVLDITNCPEGVNKSLSSFRDNCPQGVFKIIIHPFQGALLASLRERYHSMHFLHLEEVSERLEGFLKKNHLLSKAPSR